MHTVMAAEWVSLHRSLETGPPFLLVPAGPGAWVPRPTSKHVVSWGSSGEGFKMAAKMAGCLSASLSFSASLSLSRLALFSSLLQESPMRGVWTV